MHLPKQRPQAEGAGAQHLAAARQRLQGLKNVPEPSGGRKYQPKGKEGEEDGPAFKRRSVELEQEVELDEPWAALGAALPMIEVF